MRVNITRALRGEIDGINLREFLTGVTYDVDSSVGTYLVATGAADPVPSDQPAVVTQLGEAQILSTIARRVRAIADCAARGNRLADASAPTKGPLKG